MLGFKNSTCDRLDCLLRYFYLWLIFPLDYFIGKYPFMAHRFTHDFQFGKLPVMATIYHNIKFKSSLIQVINSFQLTSLGRVSSEENTRYTHSFTWKPRWHEFT